MEGFKWHWFRTNTVGLETKNESFVPIMTGQKPGPSDLLKIVRCTCKEMPDKHCS